MHGIVNVRECNKPIPLFQLLMTMFEAYSRTDVFVHCYCCLLF